MNIPLQLCDVDKHSGKYDCVLLLYTNSHTLYAVASVSDYAELHLSACACEMDDGLRFAQIIHVGFRFPKAFLDFCNQFPGIPLTPSMAMYNAWSSGLGKRVRLKMTRGGCS